MGPWPTDPMLQHNRFIAALCDDMMDGHYSLKGGKAERAAEISRQVNHSFSRETRAAEKAAGHNHGD